MTDPATPASPAASGADPAPSASSPAAPATPAKSMSDMIPMSRFNEVLGQKKELQASLEEIVTSMVEQIPEEMRELIPSDLPVTKRIKWLQAAVAKGLFAVPSGKPHTPDTKQPGAKPPENLEGLSAQSLMALGYKK